MTETFQNADKPTVTPERASGLAHSHESLLNEVYAEAQTGTNVGSGASTPRVDGIGKTTGDVLPASKIDNLPVISIGRLHAHEPEGCDVMHIIRPSFPVPGEVEAKSPDQKTTAAASEYLDILAKPDALRLDQLVKDVAADLLKGDFKDVQEILKKLEGDPHGKEKLEKLAEGLSGLLGTQVRGDHSNDKFGLDIMTAYTAATTGGYVGDTPEQSKHLFLGSQGEPRAYMHSSFPHGFADRGSNSALDLATEQTRLQALTTQGILSWHLPQGGTRSKISPADINNGSSANDQVIRNGLPESQLPHLALHDDANFQSQCSPHSGAAAGWFWQEEQKRKHHNQ